jgi:hypothetical protein
LPEIIVAGIVTRLTPKFQQKISVKTKVFELSKFDVGSEKKEAAQFRGGAEAPRSERSNVAGYFTKEDNKVLAN